MSNLRVFGYFLTVSLCVSALIVLEEAWKRSEQSPLIGWAIIFIVGIALTQVCLIGTLNSSKKTVPPLKFRKFKGSKDYAKVLVAALSMQAVASALAADQWALTDATGAVKELSGFKRITAQVLHMDTAESKRVAGQIVAVLTNAGWTVSAPTRMPTKEQAFGVTVWLRPRDHPSFSAYKAMGRLGLVEWQVATNNEAAATALTKITSVREVKSQKRVFRESDVDGLPPKGVIVIRVGRRP